MSKPVLICYRNPPPEAATRERLERFLASLCPDNLPTATTHVASDGRGLYLGVFNPADASAVRGCSAYAGWLAEPHTQWWQSGAPAPEGTYALFRGGDESIDVFVDAAASRAVWIAKTDNLFIASTSQRALAWFLHSFELNPRAVVWMLSSGSLGPGESWDRRGRPLAPGGHARLDRARWQLTIDEPAIVFRADSAPNRVHSERLRAALADVCGDLKVDWSRWMFPLSGGVDCRAILLNMRDRTGVRCITWGLRDALEIPGGDAQVAGQLAQFLGLPRRYLPTDPTDEPVEKVFGRFLLAGEGRVDHVAGYMDGLRLWSELAAAGVAGIVRGDEPYAVPVVTTAAEARRIVAMARWSDYKSLPTLQQLELTHLGGQPLPPALEQQRSESPTDWRDRLLHAFKIPTVTAALNDLKATYVEIANPLLSQRIVALARSQPARLRTGKKVLLSLNREWRLPIPYASSRAIPWAQDALALPSVHELLLDEISSARCRELFSARFSAFVANGLHSPATTLSVPRPDAVFKRKLKRLIPARLKAAARARRAGNAHPSAAQFALRAWIVTRMAERLGRDARAAGP